MMKYRFTNELDKARLDINDDITSWAYEDSNGKRHGYSAKMFKEDLDSANGKTLEIHINSCGGEVFEGFAIYNAIKDYGGEVVCYVDGLAASIASVIALSGNKLVMHNASMLMIHNASGACYGTAEEMRKVADALEQINTVIRGIYLKKINIDEDKLIALMDEEKFLTPQECIDYGFCDEITEDDKNLEDKVKVFSNYINKVDQRIQQLKDVKETLNLIGGTNECVINNDGNVFLNKKERKYAWIRKGNFK